MKNTRLEIIEKLLKRDGEYCPICGCKLDQDNVDIDHVIPVASDGTHDLSNLKLLCLSCNRRKGMLPRVMQEYEFIKYIRNLLENHPSYFNIQTEKVVNNKAMNLVFYKKENDIVEEVIAELKTVTSYTWSRIRDILQLLNDIKSKNRDARVVFIIPGELPEAYSDCMKKEGIEVWDKNFLVHEFAEQIDLERENLFSQMITGINEEDSEDSKTASPFDEFINKLKKCPTGTSNWGDYQKLVGEILEILFCPELGSPIPQSNDELHRNRRDYVMANYSNDEVWRFLRERYSAEYVTFDAKNSGEEVSKTDILQMSHYLKKAGLGLFGVIVSRRGAGEAAKYAIREEWLLDHKMILVLDDSEVEQMILDKKNNQNPAILLRKKIEDFRLSI